MNYTISIGSSCDQTVHFKEWRTIRVLRRSKKLGCWQGTTISYGKKDENGCYVEELLVSCIWEWKEPTRQSGQVRFQYEQSEHYLDNRNGNQWQLHGVRRWHRRSQGVMRLSQDEIYLNISYHRDHSTNTVPHREDGEARNVTRCTVRVLIWKRDASPW